MRPSPRVPIRTRVKRTWMAALALIGAGILVLVVFWCGTALSFSTGIGALCFAAALFLLTHGKRHPFVILTYHSVTDDGSWLPDGDALSVSPRLFERQLRMLSGIGLVPTSLRDLLPMRQSLWSQKRSAPTRVVLTFDDGYRDNYLHAYPLLLKHKFTGTIFVTPQFVDPTSSRAGRGYLSWAQMREMVQSGVIDIQAHGQTHDRVFADDTIRGFHRPGDQNGWLLWQLHPELKPRWWLENLDNRVPVGYPLYPQLPGLVARQFFPKPEIVEGMTAFARNQLTTDPFLKDTTSLYKQYRRLVASSGDSAGRFETPNEHRQRVISELSECRQCIGREIGQAPQVLCWPEECYTHDSLRAAQEAGFSATTSGHHDLVCHEDDDEIMLGRLHVRSRFFGFRNTFLDSFGLSIQIRCYVLGNYLWYPLVLLSSFLTVLLVHPRVYRQSGFRAVS